MSKARYSLVLSTSKDDQAATSAQVHEMLPGLVAGTQLRLMF